MAHDKKEYCGVFGIYGHPEAANMAYLGLYGLQHRGQESAGIVSSDGQSLHPEVGMGLVSEVFDEETLLRLPGHMAIGHNRYSTYGTSMLKNAQPILVDYARGSLALAHNGNLINARTLREELEGGGAIFRSDTDSEVMIHLIARSESESLLDRVVEAFNRVKGAYSVVLMNQDQIVGVRDPYGFRPLILGKLGDAYVLASETCVLDLIEGQYIREVQPGEIVVINEDGIKSYSPFPPTTPKHCIFEFIYFARPDSIIFGKSVETVRIELGKQLARESPVEADLVTPVPDSGMFAAMGFAEESGIPFKMGFIRSHYVGRTFIEPARSIRHFGVKLKLSAVKGVIKGRRVVVVDDSIVRGTTSRKLVQLLRDGGAKEVHMRISSPPITHSCYYGIDTPTREELIASSKSLDEITDFLTADSLRYLSLEGLLNAVAPHQEHFCCACFTGKYPVEEDWKDVDQLRLFEREL
jgi:amidophosphoribosyltransferase